MAPRVLVLVGPTASGKTAASIEAARAIGAEIVSADSRQVYRYMDIGTAKPAALQRSAVPHHFIDERDPDQEFSAGEFGTLGRARIAEILARGRVPMVVGGSGLYVRSLIDGIFEGPGADPEYRALLEQRLEAGGPEQLLAELQTVDPDSARTIDPTKPRRLMRALEVFHLSGVPMSVLHREAKPEIPFTAVQVGLRCERALLYARIDARCAWMLDAGLVEEARSLLQRGYANTLNALNTVGYAEACAFLRGDISAGELLRQFCQNTRRYAKRQTTWFRKDPRIMWIDVDGLDPGEVAAKVVEIFTYSE